MLTKCEPNADKYIPLIYETIRPIVQDIKLNPDSATMLDQIIRELSVSADATVRQTFHVLNLCTGQKKAPSKYVPVPNANGARALARYKGIEYGL